mgnify:CR=1 FL=1
MYLIKAYVRKELVCDVVTGLEEIGITRFTAIDTKMIEGKGIDDEEVSTELCETYSTMVKVEIICRKEQIDPIVEIILKKSSTGARGDGIIGVSELKKVIRVRDGKEEN